MPRTLPRRELGSTVSSQFNNQNWPTNTAAVCRTTPDHSTFLVDYQSHIISHHSSLTLPLSQVGRMSLSSSHFSQPHKLRNYEPMHVSVIAVLHLPQEPQESQESQAAKPPAAHTMKHRTHQNTTHFKIATFGQVSLETGSIQESKPSHQARRTNPKPRPHPSPFSALRSPRWRPSHYARH